MAYGNWGAFVHCDGERRMDKEDVGVFDTEEDGTPSELRIFANIMKNQEKYPEGKTPWYAHSHHAVLGDNEVRLCGYKNSPELWIIKDGEPERIEMNIEDDDSDDMGTIIVGGKTWHWSFSMYDGNMVNLMLTEPDGRVWSATCGYQYGAGHMED